MFLSTIIIYFRNTIAKTLSVYEWA
jgi:hypothetical protein